ncbi:MAG TPA: hypothetical protein VJ650_10450 [Gemmatimonadaceae bacterium]|nr:hypothetical protein [Gemmatimonadaceae bacterium]
MATPLPQPYWRRRTISTPITKVLILAREPLVAALVGMLLELEKYEPAFALPDESPEEAVRRVRPFLVLLLDGDFEEASSDVFHARLKGTPVVLFATPRTEAAVRTVANERRLPWFTMPVNRKTLGRMIREASASAMTRSGRDRRHPSAHRAPDGTLIFRDRDGGEWEVYDRRAGERRARSQGDNGYRAFVNRAGEEWWYELAPHEAAENSVDALERQLAAAVRRAQ